MSGFRVGRHIYIYILYINPPLKDGLLVSFRIESQMYCSLAQGAVLNGVFFAPGL